jgi:hypothetical protein
MNGIGEGLYKWGLYYEEGSMPRAAYLHLENRRETRCAFQTTVERPWKKDLYVCDAVSDHINECFHNGGPADQNFEPRRGFPGYVIKGPLTYNVYQPRAWEGWTFQEAENGALMCYYIHDENDEAFVITQDLKTDSVYWKYPERFRGMRTQGAWVTGSMPPTIYKLNPQEMGGAITTCENGARRFTRSITRRRPEPLSCRGLSTHGATSRR